MAVFFVRFKALDPVRGKPYFGNFELPYDTVQEALDALSQQEHIAATRFYANPKPGSPDILTVKRKEERSLSMTAIDIISLSRYKFEFALER